MPAGLELDFMDGCLRRARIEGLVAQLLRDIPLTANPILATQPSKPALLTISFLSPSAFNPSIDDDSAPSTLDIISAERTDESMSDNRFTNESGDNPEVDLNIMALSPHLARQAAC
jgi:hypothetical protein